MEYIEPNRESWAVETRLKPGWLSLKNRESWYDFWAIDGTPVGRLIDIDELNDLDWKNQFKQKDITEAGYYRIEISLKSMTFSCEKLDD